jgi:hypothetical protein
MITNGLRLPLTFDYLSPRGLAPLYVGDDVAFRFCLVNSSDVAQNLTGASIQLTIQFGFLTLTRTTGVLIPTTGTFQISIDNQGSSTPTTGLGWYQVNFSSTESATILPLVGRGSYASVITLNTRTFTHVAGPIDVLERTT